MANVAEFLPTTRGGRTLVLNSFHYRLKREHNDKTYWQCKANLCRCTAILAIGNAVTSLSGQHQHAPPSDADRWVIRKRNEMKTTIAQSNQKVQQVYKTTVVQMRQLAFQPGFGEEFAQEVAAKMPTFESVKSGLYKERSKNFPPEPENRAEVIFNDGIGHLNDGRLFLLCNDGEHNRILVFGTEANLRILCPSGEVFMDGTFKSRPLIFAQLYTMHVVRQGAMIPVMYCLLPDKSQQTYTRLFQLLINAANQIGIAFAPPTFRIDFESGVLQAINQVFPNSTIRGCFFHYTQCIWRRVQNLGLQGAFSANAEVKKFVRRMCALPLCPLDQLDDVWMGIYNEIPFDVQGVQDLCDYFVQTWLEEQALFARQIWNHFGGDGFRTNNHLEGWHNGFNKSTGVHPGFWPFVEALKTEQLKHEGLAMQLDAGHNPRYQKGKYRRLQQSHVNLRNQYLNGVKTTIEYIDAVSYLLHYGE